MKDIVKKKLPEVKEGELLSKYTTFKIGGPAKYFYPAQNNEQLIEAVKIAQEIKLPYLILSGGSNILISDRGFDGLVIKAQNSGLKVQNDEIEVDSGVMLNKLVGECTKNGLSGLEWAAGVPGTVGGAIRGNAGAKEGEMKDIVEWVEVLHEGSQIRLKNRDCQFKYRHSLFKNNNDYLIVSAGLKLKSADKDAIQKKVNEFINQRQESQPYDFPSAGCIFKNPEGDSAGRLIDQAGLKGKRIGDAQVSDKHANFIVNLGQAKAEHVVMLISLIKQKIRTDNNIQLEEEIGYIGF